MEENLLKERKETLMALMNDKAYVPMKLKELAILLGVPKEDRGELEAVLKALMADGKIAVSKKGKYARAEIFAETGVFKMCIRDSPHVLEMCGIDPEEYTGFAFGVGLERIALLKYEIDDMRLLYENDIRFLKQF